MQWWTIFKHKLNTIENVHFHYLFYVKIRHGFHLWTFIIFGECMDPNEHKRCQQHDFEHSERFFYIWKNTKNTQIDREQSMQRSSLEKISRFV